MAELCPGRLRRPLGRCGIAMAPSAHGAGRYVFCFWHFVKSAIIFLHGVIAAPLRNLLWRSCRAGGPLACGCSARRGGRLWYTAQNDTFSVSAVPFPGLRTACMEIACLPFISLIFLRRCDDSPMGLSYGGEVRPCLTNANAAVAMSTVSTQHDLSLLLFTNPTPDR